MKLTAQQVFDATLTLAQIIREKRPMPQKAKWLLARMHTKLLAEFNPIAAQRDELIRSYNYHPPSLKVVGMTDAPVTVPDETNFTVPPDKVTEFNAAWAEIGKTEIEVDVQPIALDVLCLASDANGGIEAIELQSLGGLISG